MRSDAELVEQCELFGAVAAAHEIGQRFLAYNNQINELKLALAASEQKNLTQRDLYEQQIAGLTAQLTAATTPPATPVDHSEPVPTA